MSAPAIDPSAPKTIIADTTANPAPLGLCAFGLTTFLLNAHNAGFFALDAMILAMGLFYGGMAQLFVGWMEWKKGATFGTLALNTALQVTFGLLIGLFALLVLANATHGMEISHTLHTLAGWEGMATAFAAMYTGLAQVMNEVHGKVVWPLNKAAAPAPKASVSKAA